MAFTGRPRGWERTCKRIIARDDGVCQIRGPGCTIIATAVDHILPRSKGGGHEDGNLRASCRMCNSRRGNRMTKLIVMPNARRSRWS